MVKPARYFAWPQLFGTQCAGSVVLWDSTVLKNVRNCNMQYGGPEIQGDNK